MNASPGTKDIFAEKFIVINVNCKFTNQSKYLQRSIMSKKKNKSIVYSTDPEYQPVCEVCLEPPDRCRCQIPDETTGREVAHLRREHKGRAGKTVTTISNLKGELRPLQRELQKLCGTGGTVKNGIIEIQGDFRDKIRQYLEQKGYGTKLIGG